MADFTIIRPGGVTTPGSTPITIPGTLPTGVAPPPAAPDLPGLFTSVDFASALAGVSRTPIYQAVISRPLSSTAGASAYWTLDEASGATRVDSIGSNHLASVNTVGQATGTKGTAAQFNSASSRYLTVATPGTAILHKGYPFSITCWVYLDSKAADMGIACQYGTTLPSRSWALMYQQSTDRFLFLVNDGVAGQQTVTADAFGSPALSTWYFVEASYHRVDETTSIHISVNLLGNTATTIPKPSVITQPFEVGRVNGASYFDGRIDDLRFFKYELTDDERAALYTGSTVSGNVYEFCSSHPASRDPIGDELMIPISLEQRAEIEQCRFPLSTLTFALVADDNGIVRGAITDGLIGNKVEFYLGFYDLPWEANKRLRFTGIISEITQTAGVYQFVARSPMAVAEDIQVFNGAQTQLSAAITATDTVFNVVDTSAFAEPNISINETYPVVTDNEWSFPRGRTATQFTPVSRIGNTLYGIPPMMPNSQSTSHVIGTPVKEIVELGQLTGTNSDAGVNDLHPMDQLKNFLTGHKEKASLGAPPLVAVNNTELSAAKTALGANLKFKFSFAEPMNGKEFAEKELFSTTGGYPRENASGQLGIKSYQDASAATIVDTITDADIIGWPHWLRNADKIVTVVTIKYDYDPIAKEYSSAKQYFDETLIAQYGERELIIESKGIRSQFIEGGFTWFSATDAFLTDLAQRIIARFGGKSPVFAVTTTLDKQLLNVGDDVEVSFSQMPDIDTGEIELVSKKCEIQALKFDFQANTIDIEVMAYPS